jgi:hypothetical protein
MAGESRYRAGNVDDAARLALLHLRRDRLDQRHRRAQVDGEDLLYLRLGELIVRRAVEDAGVVDEDVDLAEGGDELGDAREIRQVIDDLARILVQREDAETALLEELGGRLADALRGAGDEDCLQVSPGMVKPAPLRSRISSSS